MAGINWDQIISNAAHQTDEHFKSSISSLSSLNDSEIDSLMTETGISKEDLVAVLKAVNDATKSNEEKARAISNITNGVKVVVGIASKFI